MQKGAARHRSLCRLIPAESEQNQQHPLHVRIHPLSDESMVVVLDALNGSSRRVRLIQVKMKVNRKDEHLRRALAFT